MDDRLFYSDAINKHANVQSRAVFFNAMTVMDNVHGWEEEEKWVGSKFAACMWDLHLKCAYRVVETHFRNAGVPEADDVIHYAVRE